MIAAIVNAMWMLESRKLCFFFKKFVIFTLKYMGNMEGSYQTANFKIIHTMGSLHPGIQKLVFQAHD